jgi:hypothetical protein
MDSAAKDLRLKTLEDAIDNQLQGLRSLQQLLSPLALEGKVGKSGFAAHHLLRSLQDAAVIREAYLKCNTLEKTLWTVQVWALMINFKFC